VLVDQVGYESQAPKQGLVLGSDQDHPSRFSLVDSDSGRIVLAGELQASGKVYGWGGRLFWTADFSSWKKPGHYVLQVDSDAAHVSSCTFEINDDVLERDTLSNVVFYFKGQRASGLLDQADRHLALPDHSGFVDVHGGWYDATGDYGIHLSHQNLTSYFNPQQVPLVAWSLLKSYEALVARKDDNFSEYEWRLLDEGLFGADYLVAGRSLRRIARLAIQTGGRRSRQRVRTRRKALRKLLDRILMRLAFVRAVGWRLRLWRWRARCRWMGTIRAGNI